jgi:hypothetical protein
MGKNVSEFPADNSRIVHANAKSYLLEIIKEDLVWAFTFCNYAQLDILSKSCVNIIDNTALYIKSCRLMGVMIDNGTC